jgi:diguanylate cyclase (GGDEF)-like protein
MPNRPTNSYLILIIEDNKSTRQSVTNALSNLGYQVIEATNGSDGFTRFIESRPSLVLIDSQMPVMNGMVATKAIRNFESGRTVPILMLTPTEDIVAIDQAFEAGATGFITKPINWALLTQRVKYALRTADDQELLRINQSQLIFAQKIAKLGYWEWDAARNEVSGSQSAFSQFGIPKQDGISLEQFFSNVLPKDKPIIQQAISEAHQGQSHLAVSVRVLKLDGNLNHIEFLGEASYHENGQIHKITGSAQDISRLHKAETLVQYQAQHDGLTDLPNRNTFSKTLNKLVAQQKTNALSAVLIFDIDRFKKVNTNLGQEQGDLLLLSLAQRLNRITRENDFVARLGSDEFAILIRQLQDSNELKLLVNRISRDLNAPFMLNNGEQFISYSVGVSVFPDDANSAEALLTRANIARATAKSRGGNQFVFYHEDMNAQAQDLLSLENDLRRAVKRKQIEVYYQPQVDAKTLQPIGAEALVRWLHPKLGIISPEVFIPMAESTGLIIDIGRHVLQVAIQQAEIWHQMGFTQMRIGINLSGRQFTQSNLMEDVQAVISQSNLPARFIDLEITESLAMSDAETNINILNGLKTLGTSLSIDDFGTGYSSLAYLHKFPIDTIKIDRSFVLNLDNQEGQAIARTILAMAKSLNLEVVAEGIEFDDQVDFFQNKHCDIFQGFKFGKPMPDSEFIDWLNHHP